MSESFAFGAPGIEPRWTSSAKTGVGTALGTVSRVWFTISHGIFNEIYYPHLDQACTRDFGLLVTDNAGFFSEEKRGAASRVERLAPGVPAFRLTNTCRQGRYRIEKEILCDPLRSTVLQRTRFSALSGSLEDYHLYALLAPHIGNRGWGNTAWVGDFKGMTMLFAARGATALALACGTPFLKRSAGFVGRSDGWQDLNAHRRMEWEFTRAENGNVALMGELDLAASGGELVLAVGFGRSAEEAGLNARISLEAGFDPARAAYVRAWTGWRGALRDLDGEDGDDLYAISAAVLRTHEAKDFPGGVIASLSVPWGASKSDDDLGGYHLVWPRDLAEVAGALLAAGARADAFRILEYLQATQEADGHWTQNMWIEGSPYWHGIQLDETGFPVLLADMARRMDVISGVAVERFWPMVRSAAAYLVRCGPVSDQDRWEEDPGTSPFTLAVEIAALLAAADYADLMGEKAAAGYLRETADAWNASVERWTYAEGTELARRLGVRGYYIRVAPPETADATSPVRGFVPVKNRPPGSSSAPAAEIISPDALALVRFGLRAPDDPRIRDTVAVIDALLKVETPFGPAWHRYNDDGYGEHEDGSPFDGTGVGRAWPLLAGERAHYEIAAGNLAEAKRLLKAFGAFANEGGMLPEQVWDSPDIPSRELFLGRPSGSAMPLAWAHAEYVKLLRSLRDGAVFDMPPQTVERYLKQRVGSRLCVWRLNHKCRSIPAGKTLRLQVPAAALVRWSADGWSTVHDDHTEGAAFGLHVLDLPTETLKPGGAVTFTFHWEKDGAWEGGDFAVAIEP